MGPIGSPETSVRNYHYSLCNNPEEQSSHLLRGGSLQSRVSPSTELFSVIPRIIAKESHRNLLVAVNWPGTADVSGVKTILYTVSLPHSCNPRNNWQSLTSTHVMSCPICRANTISSLQGTIQVGQRWLNEKAGRNYPLVEAGVDQPLATEFYPVGFCSKVRITGNTPPLKTR
jgi:hypothetical protein